MDSSPYITRLKPGANETSTSLTIDRSQLRGVALFNNSLPRVWAAAMFAGEWR